jgi:diguanylate cyclase (GGDEF)-like protein
MAIAVAASIVALALTFQLRTHAMAHTIWKRLAGALVMGGGIVGMHYTGMVAAQFAPGTICTAPAGQFDQHWLALAVGASSLLFLGATMLILTVDVRLAQQLDSANAKIAELARTDPLTGLANRRTFLERLDDAFRARNRDDKPSAILCLDLDGFKDINDTLGHPMGDALLVEVAARLKGAVRQNDLVARFGGDEFAVLLTGIDDASAGRLAAKIGDALAARYCIDGQEMHVTASIGIAPLSVAVSTPEALMMQADVALYRAKDEGRNCHRFHNLELDRQVRRRTLLARDLHFAIERHELELFYEPQVQIGSGRIIGFESLVRWNHPARGMIKPSVFIPIAETTGTIAAIGNWIFDQACRQVRQWQDEGIASPLVTVDISAGQLKTAPDLVGDMSAALAKWGIAAVSIELELTETVLAQATQKHEAVINSLGELGFRLAIDDFGMGYSSLSVLAACPVGRLKIAGDLVAGALRNDRSATVVCAAVQLANQLGVDVVADGVESEVQVKFLSAAGCDQAQGPFFFPPLSARDATSLLTAQSAPRRSTSPAA